MISGIATFVIWYSVYLSTPSSPSSESEEEEDDVEVDEISQAQSWRTREERTWGNWFRYMIENWVYEDLFDSLDWMGIRREGQQQELSIRLVDAATEDVTVDLDGEGVMVFTYFSTDIDESLVSYHWYKAFVLE